MASVIVVDTGRVVVRAGFADQDAPEAVNATVVGRPRYPGIIPNTANIYIGEEAMRKRGLLHLKFPVERRAIVNWDDMEHIWRHTFFNELAIDPQEFSIILTETFLGPKANRERITQIMFETFNFDGIFICNGSVLALYSYYKTTGIVVDSGEDVTHIVPVYEGYMLPHAVHVMSIAGRDVTDYLCRISCERGYAFETTAERLQMTDVKEKICYVTPEFEDDMRLSVESSILEKCYEFPSGDIWTYGNERFRAPEIMFQPILMGSEETPLHEALLQSIMKCDDEIRSELFSNVALAGGNTLLEGFALRLKKELKTLAPKGEIVKILAASNRQDSTWIGGATIASISRFRDTWIKKEEYEQNGPGIVHRKCFSSCI